MVQFRPISQDCEIFRPQRGWSRWSWNLSRSRKTSSNYRPICTIWRTCTTSGRSSDWVDVVILPGNHDAVRPAEPQPALDPEVQQDYSDGFLSGIHLNLACMELEFCLIMGKVSMILLQAYVLLPIRSQKWR